MYLKTYILEMEKRKLKEVKVNVQMSPATYAEKS